MQKEDAFDLVRSILRSPNFHAQSFEEKTGTLEGILETKEVTKLELSFLINQERHYIPEIDLENIGEWVDYIINRFEDVKSEEEFSDLFFYLRKKLTYTDLKDGTVSIIHAMFVNREKRLLPSFKYWTSQEYYRWPHQNIFDAFMGVLFYPVESDEVKVGRILRLHIQDMIAFSAYHKNTLAQYYLVDIFEFYEEIENPDEENNIDDIQLRIDFLNSDPFVYYFGEENKRLLDYYINDSSNLLPYYYGYLLCIYGNNYLKSQKCLKAGTFTESKDRLRALCALDYGYNLKNNGIFPEEIKEIIRQIDPKMLSGILAFEINDIDSRIELYLEAEDYHTAAILAPMSHKHKKNQIEYFRLAGENGNLSSYDNAAQLYLLAYNTEAAKRLFEKQGNMGDQEGYNKLGNLYLESNDQINALKWFKKADLSGYRSRLLLYSHGDSLEQEDAIIEEQDEREREKYQFLISASKGI